MFMEFKDLYIRGLEESDLFRRREIRKITGMSITNTGRVCANVEFIDGTKDQLPLMAQGRDWFYCDGRGTLIQPKE